MNSETVKENIKKIRNSKGLSQTQMAQALGISTTAYNNLETGTTHLIYERMEQIARTFGVSTEEIVLGYKPVDESVSTLKDIECRYEGKIESIKKAYEMEIASLKEAIKYQQQCIDALKDSCTSKDEIIALQRSIISQKEEH